MNYIYDILLNFQDYAFDFYDWNYNDKITHIRKIPMFKINEKTMDDFLNFNIIFNNELLKMIFKKTEIFSKKTIKTINYSFIVSDGINSLSLLLNNKGNIIKRSKLIIDEDIEVCEFSEHLLEKKLYYEKTSKFKNFIFKTRNEELTEKKLLFKLNKIKDDQEQMKYIYYECFNKKNNDVNFIYNIIKTELNKNYNLLAPKLNNILNLQENC